LIFSLLFAGGVQLPAQDDTTSVVMVAQEPANYPARPLLLSLVLPGAGQYYNKSPLWKSASFLGVEAISVAGWFHFNGEADVLKNNYQMFADENWNLQTWYYFTLNGPDNRQEYDGRAWTENDFKAMRDYEGTHHLTLHLTGELAALYGEFVSSDSLGVLSDSLGTDNITVVRDRHFYENVGKYDQFVGGWSDINTDWYWEEKDVGDSIEIVIKTPMKANYLDQRFESNQMLTFAKYSVSVLMFNHVVSGLEAVWSSQRKTQGKTQSNKIETDVSLLYNPYNVFGIGGVSFTFGF
jgi:hypothetical protein